MLCAVVGVMMTLWSSAFLELFFSEDEETDVECS